MRKLGGMLVLVAIIASGVIGWYFADSMNSGRGNESSSVAVGMMAPDFELADKAGKVYSLSALRGKVVLINFWATWCPPCRKEMPSMEQLYGNYSKGGLELLAINVETNGPEIIDEFQKEFPHTFPVIFDLNGAVQQDYGVFKFPETFIVNKQGIIVERVIGAIDWADPSVLSYLNKLM